MKKSRSHRSVQPGIIVRYQRKGGVIVALDVSGHAGFAACGRDIVCAAASALIFASAYGLRHHCRQRISVRDDQEQYSLRLTGAINARARALVETLVSGLKAMAHSYPGYIKVNAARR